VAGADGGVIRVVRPGRTTITLTYQRERSHGGYRTVYNITRRHVQRVSVTIRVTVSRNRR
jgi:hypothetical protein